MDEQIHETFCNGIEELAERFKHDSKATLQQLGFEYLFEKIEEVSKKNEAIRYYHQEGKNMLIVDRLIYYMKFGRVEPIDIDPPRGEMFYVEE